MPENAVIDATCSRCEKDGRGNYRTSFRCRNCGLEGEAIHSRTHEAWRAGLSATCPRCACRSLQMGEYIQEAHIGVPNERDLKRGEELARKKGWD